MNLSFIKGVVFTVSTLGTMGCALAAYVVALENKRLENENKYYRAVALYTGTILDRHDIELTDEDNAYVYKLAKELNITLPEKTEDDEGLTPIQ